MINGENVRLQLQSYKLDKKWLKCYYKSSKAGDTSSVCIGASGDRCEALQCRFKNSKYNNSTKYDYIPERLFSMKIEAWDYD